MLTTTFNNKKNALKTEHDLKLELRLLSEQQSEINNKNSIAKTAEEFTGKAIKLGIDKDQWIHLDVNIDEEVTVYELSEILNQCSNKNLIYYKPGLLKIKKIDKDINKSKKSSDSVEKDFKLTLQGAFLVKNK